MGWEERTVMVAHMGSTRETSVRERAVSMSEQLLAERSESSRVDRGSS